MARTWRTAEQTDKRTPHDGIGRSYGQHRVAKISEWGIDTCSCCYWNSTNDDDQKAGNIHAWCRDTGRQLTTTNCRRCWTSTKTCYVSESCPYSERRIVYHIKGIWNSIDSRSKGKRLYSVSKCNSRLMSSTNTKLSCCRETARRFVSLNILLSHSRSLKVIRNDTVE